MSKISNIINSVKEFAGTESGKVAINGIATASVMALDGLIAKKLSPEKATFGRAMALGICAVAAQTLLGSAVAAEQEQRADNLEIEKELQRDRLMEECLRLRGCIFELQEKIKEAEEASTEQKRLERALRMDLTGTTRSCEKMRMENEILKGEIDRLNELIDKPLAQPNAYLKGRDILDDIINRLEQGTRSEH